MWSGFKSDKAVRCCIRDKVAELGAYGDPTGVFIDCVTTALDTESRELRLQEVEERARTLVITAADKLGGGRYNPVEVYDLAAVVDLLGTDFPSLEDRQAGDLVFRYVPGRSHRPARYAGQALRGNWKPFDEKGFHFDIPRLEREILFSGVDNVICGRPVWGLGQKYQLAAGEFLVVPNLKDHLPQLLVPDLHRWACETTASVLPPGYVLGWNSLGDGGGSVNQAHFRCLPGPFPVESQTVWNHHNGSNQYPARVIVFPTEESVASGRYIGALNETGLAYNVLYTKTAVYVFPRHKMNVYVPALFTSMFAIVEMAGVIVCTRYPDFLALVAAGEAKEETAPTKIEAEFAKLWL